MNLSRSTITLILIALSAIVAPGALAQAPAADPAAPAASSEAPPETFNLDITNEGGVHMVLMQKLFKVVKQLFPDAEERWDPASGIMRIEADGKVLDILSRASAVVIDGHSKSVPHSVVIRQGNVKIPLETVKMVLDTLGVEFDIKKEEEDAAALPAAPLPTPAPTAAPKSNAPAIPTSILSADKETTPAASALSKTAPPAQAQATPVPKPARPTPTPTQPTSPLLANSSTIPITASAIPQDGKVAAQATPAAKPASSAPAVVLPSFQEKSAEPAQPAAATANETPLEPPTALAGKVGLSWGQLADLAHRAPPRRITLVCDAAQKDLAQDLSASLQQGRPTEVTVLVAPSSQRTDQALLDSVVSSRPDLLLDLVVSPKPAGAEDAETYVVWAVHEALWPQDREGGKTAAAQSQQRYRRHQFQSLALGSLLKREIGNQFQERSVVYELAPSYLLRRVDAPSAEVLIPTPEGEKANKGSTSRQSRLVEALSTAVGNYIHGMERVQF